MGSFESGVAGYVKAYAIVEVFFPVNDKGFADISCVRCPYLSSNDRMCQHFIKKAAEQIGLAIANAVNLLNPQMIVLYGFMLELGDYFLSHLERAIRENVIFLANDFEVRISTVS